MKVKTIREHSNRHAPAGRKVVGAVYAVADAEAANLAAAGLVEPVSDAPAKPKRVRKKAAPK